jgi:hypothetical protein
MVRRSGLVVVALAAVGVFAPASAQTSSTKVITVAHGAVTTLNSQYVDLGVPGPSVGDIRTYYIPLTDPKSGKAVGFLTGTLTTVAVEHPAAGMELRTSDLVFVVGKMSDQIVVGGVAAYEQSAPSVATRSVVTRPVVGGSGKYAGARGWVVSTHFADNTWTHVFHLIS